MMLQCQAFTRISSRPTAWPQRAGTANNKGKKPGLTFHFVHIWCVPRRPPPVRLAAPVGPFVMNCSLGRVEDGGLSTLELQPCLFIKGLRWPSHLVGPRWDVSQSCSRPSTNIAARLATIAYTIHSARLSSHRVNGSVRVCAAATRAGQSFAIGRADPSRGETSTAAQEYRHESGRVACARRSVLRTLVACVTSRLASISHPPGDVKDKKRERRRRL